MFVHSIVSPGWTTVENTEMLPHVCYYCGELVIGEVALQTVYVSMPVVNACMECGNRAGFVKSVCVDAEQMECPF